VNSSATHTPRTHNAMSEAALVIVWVGCGLILVLGLIGALLPFWLRKSEGEVLWWQTAMNCLAGGVLFGAGVLHMIPDLVLASKMVHIEGTPTPYLFVAVGLLVPFAIENSDAHQHLATPPAPRNSDIEMAPVHARARMASSDGEEALEETTIFELATEPVTGKAQAEPEVLTAPPPAVPSAAASPLLLVLTLGIHSVLEGIGIGVQQEIGSSLSIVAAVVAHKGFAGFALGQLFAMSGYSFWKALPSLLLFAVATPIGIVAGVVVNAQISSPWVDVVAVGLASGTFIFVAMFDILQVELKQPRALPQWGKWASFLAGVGLFTIVGFVIGSNSV
jgi:zinc transporter ZupT